MNDTKPQTAETPAGAASVLPVFTHSDAECLKRYEEPGNMRRVMEVYDLRADKDEQMNERRAMRLPEAANVGGNRPPRTDDGQE